MKQIRSMPPANRRDFYLKERIEQQRQWYSDRAKTNQDKEFKWFLAIMLAQFLAAASAFMLVRWPESNIRLTAVFSTVAAAFIAWLQVKRHQELAQSYGLTAHELGLIAASAVHVSTDAELSGFVGDAENAISREHTMWVARRDQP